MPELGDFLVGDAVVWARPDYGPMGPKERTCAWGKEMVARRIEREARSDHDLIMSIGVGRPLPTLPKNLTGALLDIATVVPRLMRTEDIIGREQYQQWLTDWPGSSGLGGCRSSEPGALTDTRPLTMCSPAYVRSASAITIPSK